MKRLFSLIIAIVFAMFCLPLTACAGDDTVYLNVYNWEEYIAEGDEFDMVSEFEKWYKDTYGKTVKVNYSTYGTNENMYNELKLTKNKKKGTYSYDLVCPSDYMLQQMIKENMLEKFTLDESGYYEKMPNYDDYTSDYIRKLFDKYGWNEYAVCYMWGTMGYVYNPEKVADEDMTSWNGILNPKYKYKSTIKDSPRDSYILAMGIACEEELNNFKTIYGEGTTEYNEKIVELFNRSDAKSVEQAGNVLRKVKDSIFGFEVDTGKADMASGKLWINFAWSGDAVYTLDVAEEMTGAELYYSVPEEGSNIWFDGWVMPKGANKELAQAFLNFMYNPQNAIENMNYIGYTPATAGDVMFENAIDWYGLNVLIEADETDEDAVLLDGVYYKEVYFGDLSENELESMKNGDLYNLTYAVYDEDEENIIGLESAEDVEVYANDITYFFSNLSDEYLDEDGRAIVYTDNVNRQFTTQYPSEEIVNRCAIMLYFDKQENARLNNMWSSVKIGYMSPALMIAVVIAIILAIVAFVVVTKLIKSGKFGYGKVRKDLTLVSKKEIKK